MTVLMILLGCLFAICGAAAAGQFTVNPNWQLASASIVLLLAAVVCVNAGLGLF